MNIASIGISDVCSAFSPRAIGSKVMDRTAFLMELRDAIKTHDWNACRVEGQALVDVPAAIPYVSSGVGASTGDPDAYVLRTHRGRVSAYLKREKAAPVESLKVVVYTLNAYRNDPQVSETEVCRMLANAYNVGDSGETYVVVAVLASAGEPPVRSPYRFVDCLAGGNNEADTWSLEDVRRMAREVISGSDSWSVVAD